MIPGAEQYPFVVMDPTLGAASSLPFLPITLTHQQRSASVMGLLDSASAVNVLPHDVGLQLGFVWAEQTTAVRLTGNLANFEARVVTLTATIGRFPPLLLAFAWTQANTVPVILGQVNFFMEFDVFLSRARSVFEVKPK